MRDVEALVALQPDQARAERARDRFRRLGLPDAGLALEEQRLLECQRQVERSREPALRQIGRARERRLELVDRGERH